MRKVVVGFSGGVTSAWCAGWALRTFPREEVILLFCDTKEEDEDTYRFLREMAAALGMQITNESDGRSLTEVIEDENMIPNNQFAFCSRILKQEPANRFIRKLQEQGCTEIIRVMGFSGNEPDRMQRHVALAWMQSTFWCPVSVHFPIAESKTTKQQCADWCSCEIGVKPSAMYEWSEHANCPGCFRGGRNYWKAVEANRPDIYAKRSALEQRMGHTVLPDVTLDQLRGISPRKIKQRESIEIGPCECGS